MNRIPLPKMPVCIFLFATLLALLCLLGLPLGMAQAQDNQIPLVLETVTAETDFTTSQAWGDFDNDGDLDLIVGNGILGFPNRQQNRLYCNEGGVLRSCWLSAESEFTLSVAWGDVDGDQDLDLAVGNGAIGGPLGVVGVVNRVYLNEGKDGQGNPRFTPFWEAPKKDTTIGVAWGDYDNDGDLDLAVANGTRQVIPNLLTGNVIIRNLPQANRVYRNTLHPEGELGWVLETEFSQAFSAPREMSFSVAWVDADNDGFLDLAVTNDGPNRVYCNRAQGQKRLLQECWNSAEDQPDQFTSTSMSWGDYDGDGWLDLAVGNGEMFGGQPNQLYHNDRLTADGKLRLTLVPAFAVDPNDATTSIAWGDADRDGDLDLAVGNGNFVANQQSRIYCNENKQINPIPCWSSPQASLTLSAAWGDVDGDGDLDLALGNISVPVGQNNLLYRNDSVPLATAFDAWTAADEAYTRSLAWGDVDGDGDLDLMAGNKGLDRLFRNDEGILTEIANLGFDPDDDTSSVAWGDMDNDGDLDLLVGNTQSHPSLLYCNQSDRATKTIVLTRVPDFALAGDTSSVAWGDMDGDGDLDLALGNGSLNNFNIPQPQPNRIYRNEGSSTECRPHFTEVWVAQERSATRAVAWGDVDRDGDLDLAVGNAADANRLYRNDGQQRDGAPIFTLLWTAIYTDDTHSIAWGDMNGDGWLDLAVGNTNQSNRVYCNLGGTLTSTDCWRSLEADRTRSIAWGDIDGDGDLDLTAGNQEGPERLYLNLNRTLATSAAWSSDDSALFANGAGRTTGDNRSWTLSVAWGDLDGDGDLDLAAGNSEGQRSGIYRNLAHSSQATLDQAPYAALTRPGKTPAAAFFSSAEILQAGDAISIPYLLYSPNPSSTIRIFPEYSVNGGGQWFPATAAAGAVITGLHASAWPTGTSLVFLWNAAHDLIKEDNVAFRIRAQADQQHSPISGVAAGSQSPPFRVVAPWYVRVYNAQRQPVIGALVYAAGQLITTTNRAGLVGPQLLDEADESREQPLVALAPIYQHKTPRLAHPDQAAYTIYQTTLTERELGLNRPYTATDSGEQLLTTAITMPLTLFNLVVSIEWPTDITYTRTISQAMRWASDYLFDLTDGQMAFGQVAIYDNARHWADADIQIAAQNMVHPHAYVGGIEEAIPSQVMHIGRGWDGKIGDNGLWSAPDGFRTIAHEFGHYGLSLYDEYFRYREVNGSLGERVEDIACTGIENQNPLTDATNASAMDRQYTSSELSDQDLPQLWGDNCNATAHFQLTGQSVWETLVQHFGDKVGVHGRFLRPADRQALLLGPDQLPTGLPKWPSITATYSLSSSLNLTLTLLNGDQPFAFAGVTLYKEGGRVIEQGRTNERGQLVILGAAPNDVLRFASSDGALGGSLVVSTTFSIIAQALPVGDLPPPAAFMAGAPGAAATPLQTPYLRITPEQVHDGENNLQLVFTAYNFDRLAEGQAGLTVIVNAPGQETARFTQAAYSPTTDGYQYTGRLAFTAGQEDANNVQVIGAVNNQVFFLQSSYRLQRIVNHERQIIYANDGNLSLELNPQSFMGAATYVIVNAQSTPPGAPPLGFIIVSDVYEITASGTLPKLDLPAALTINYATTHLPGGTGGNTSSVAPALYEWDANTRTWKQTDATSYPERKVIATQIEMLGIYAVMVKP